MLKQTFIIILSFLTILSVSAQRRNIIEHVDKDHKITNTPYLMLPQTAVKLDFNLAEFKYTPGSDLRKLVSNYKDCSEDNLKKNLQFLEDRYGVSVNILIQLLKRKPDDDEKEFPVIKLDKDIKMSFFSVADYDKVYRYKTIKGFNSSSLGLEYDDNGILVSSSVTHESKLVPAIVSAVSGVASIATAFAKGATIPLQENQESTKPVTCPNINSDYLNDLDELLTDYNSFLKGSGVSIYTDKHFQGGKDKFEEEIGKAFAKVFYNKEIVITPLQVLFVIPKAGNANDSQTCNLFSYDASTHKFLLNDDYKQNIIAFPKEKFSFSKSLDKPFKMELEPSPGAFDANASLDALMDTQIPGKITAVYNIPRLERIRLLKPSGSEAIKDTVIKVPQNGRIGYLSTKLTSLQITYNMFGEIKKLSAEKKSSVDTLVASGATSSKDLVTAIKGKSELDELTEKEQKLELLQKIHDLETGDDSE